jgi:uncharacterized protein (TIGR03000 family)
MAHLEVHVPGSASLWFNGWKASSAGTVRELQSPVLKAGRRYTYTVRAQWAENGREVTQTQQVPVRAGARVQVTFPVQPRQDRKDEKK